MPTYNPHWETRHLRLRAEWLPTCDQTAVEAAYRGFHEDSFHDDLPHIGIPTLLLVAGKGGVILPDDIAEIRALAPKVAIEEAPNCGHMIPWDDFEVFFRAIGPFLGLE
jgi:N-formylmaleamate deformylase